MKTSPSKHADNDISAEVAEVSSGAPVAWTRVGAVLDRVDQEGYWRNESSSFTEWVKFFSSKLGLKEGSVWRMLTSSRSYIELQKDLTSRGINAPLLNQLSTSVSPEKLELLDKLRRVAKQDITDSIASRVIEDSITRDELRATWETYRPVLDGRTARGRGVEPPRFDPTDQNQFSSYHAVEVMSALQAAGPHWTGKSHPATYRIFTRVRPERRDDDKSIFELDVVAVVREKKTSPIIFHGIEIRGPQFLAYSKIDKFRKMAEPYLDYYWIASAVHTIDELESGVGLLSAFGTTVTVLRPAICNTSNATRKGDLAMGLLQRLLKT